MLTNQANQSDKKQATSEKSHLLSPPSISLPKGGGAIRGMGEKFAANPVTGTGSMTVPIATSPGRSGFGPQLSLSYDSGAANGPFGFGWSLALPSITRKTDKGLPRYFDAQESDVFILSGAEDLVPVYRQDPDGSWVASHPGYQRDPDGFWVRDKAGRMIIHQDKRDDYQVRRYRPRIEGLFARIERWTHSTNGEIHWRSISKDNITTLYGQDNASRIFDPADPDPDHPTRIFSWLIRQSYDDKGNAIVYEYAEENDNHVDRAQANERNRGRTANRYLKRIKYGNRTPNRDLTTWQATDPAQLPDKTWMFKVVFDYGQGLYTEDAPDNQGRLFAQAQIDPPNGTLWPVRQDPFSSYRAGFEVRTYRLCRRVLMFHRFPQELGIQDCLVRSTEFSYSQSPIAAFNSSVTQSGYVRRPVEGQPNRYLKKSLPPLEFKYSQVPSPEQLAQQPVREVDAESVENLPVGLDGGSYQWMDLDGDGTSGVLTEQGGSWYYKRNLSANHQVREDGHSHTVARLGPAEPVGSQPAAGLAGGAQFLDLAGDGQVDLVQMEGSVRGFYERTTDANWEPFRTFASWPDLNTRDPQLKFVDLTGDGHTDLLITEGEVLTWYPSLAEAGFGPALRVRLPADEEKGPQLVFADGTESIYLADLSGDGLSDLVRIRNGDVCYWPNLGYGHFGAKVTMDHAPWFDSPDQFDQRRIRLADTDGSGTTDILYLRRDGVHIYFNQSGNRWSEGVALPQFPPIDNISSVNTLDLLGNGTACLVWSSPLPGAAHRPMRYLALIDEKPHLLVEVKNNLGAETRVYYAPSTRFYLDDRQNGRPWLTRLPFPVHVVERVETFDWISRNYFVARYAYHHGYFDGEEREFRGFGKVEQWDTEVFDALGAKDTVGEASNLSAASHAPPVRSVTWFHTGAYLDRDSISRQFAAEYYGAPQVTGADVAGLWKEFEATLLPDTLTPSEVLLPKGSRTAWPIDTGELREAVRALKGSILRQEIYAEDGSVKSQHPYTVSERNYTIDFLQPRGPAGRHAVFFVHPRETIDYHHERNPADPRIQHALTLQVDGFGNVLKSAAIGYGRREKIAVIDEQGRIKELPNPGLMQLDPPDQAKQTTTLITYTENRVATDPITYAIDTVDDYRTPLPCESRTYEFTGFKPENDGARFSFDQWTRNDFALPGLAEVPYEQPADGATKQKRLIEHVRTLFRPNDLGAAQNDPLALLSLGTLGSLALSGERYQLALTPGLMAQVYQRPLDVIQPPGSPPPERLLPRPADVLAGQGEDEGGYVDLDGDDHWWMPSGRAFFSLGSADTPAQELGHARRHFFQPHRYCDPFSSQTALTYDDHDLLLVETRDALGNVVTANTLDDGKNAAIRNDYRVLQPYWVTDPNGNRVQVTFDALSMVVATAVMGKPGEDKGDHLIDFEADLTQSEIDAFHDANDPHRLAEALLQGATTRIVYDLDRFRRSQLAHPEDQSPWQPPYAATLTRETHARESLPPHGLKIQISFSCSDGFGREIQKKIQAEPGEVDVEDAAGTIMVVDTTPNLRWVGSGWTIYNNKGKPVRQYEPFFSTHHHFQFGKRVGVSPVLFYDPVERVIATLHPNHTWDKVVFDSWQQTAWDVNDTVLGDPRTDADVQGYTAGYFASLQPAPPWRTWHAQRQGGALGLREQIAASRAADHAGTPTTAFFDTLSRPFLTVTHNRVVCPNHDLDGTEDRFSSRVELDIEGNQRAVRDADRQRGDPLGRLVMRYHYDMLGNRIHQASMEAGERWVLNDVAGKPIRAWDSRGFMRRMTYDELRRPTGLWVTKNGEERMAEQTHYGESQGQTNNHRTRVYQVLDGAGIVTSEGYDYKGNLLRGKRELLPDYRNEVDWKLNPDPSDGTFVNRTEYDALNRPIQWIAPHSDQPGAAVNVIEPSYNEANLLEQVHAWLNARAEPSGWLDPATASLHAVTDIDYNAKGQRTCIDYGNGATTTYEYDPLTYRLIHFNTTRPAGLNGLAAQLFADPAIVQDLHYTYDPAGNITHIQDGALPAVQFNGQNVEPGTDYIYDAIYRLISAHGREHAGQTAFDFDLPEGSRRDYPFAGLRAGPNDPQAMRNYAELYQYDEVGNFKKVHHQAATGSWTRDYEYDADSQIEEAGKKSNRLTLTTVGNGVGFREVYAYKDPQGRDVHGCMTSINFMGMAWDFEDQLQRVDLGGGGTAYYVYDAGGQRVRKVIHRHNGTRQKEHIYLGGFEIYREYNGGSEKPAMERETLHLMDDQQRIALVETKTKDAGVLASTLPETLKRFQFGTHLGSASLELDELAQIISYEEYCPYGSTSYQAVRSHTEAPRRYRYTGKERDEETGFAYHGARYYAPWLGRWTSADPIGLTDGPNSYEYSRSDPVRLSDPHGLQSQGDLSEEEKRRIENLTARTLHHSYQTTQTRSRAEFAEDLKEVNKPALATVRRREAAFQRKLEKAVKEAEMQAAEPDAGPNTAEWQQTVIEELKSGKSPEYKASYYAHARPDAPAEKDFIDRGGATLVSGGLTLAGGFASLASGPVGWGAGLVTAFAISGGVVGTTAGVTQIAVSYGSDATEEQNAALGKAFSITADMGSSPFGLAGGLLGVGVGGSEGMGRGAAIGSLTGSAIGLLPGKLRSYELTKPREWGTGEIMNVAKDKPAWTIGEPLGLSDELSEARQAMIRQKAEDIQLPLSRTRFSFSSFTKERRYVADEDTSASQQGQVQFLIGPF